MPGHRGRASSPPLVSPGPLAPAPANAACGPRRTGPGFTFWGLSPGPRAVLAQRLQFTVQFLAQEKVLVGAGPHGQLVRSKTEDSWRNTPRKGGEKAKMTTEYLLNEQMEHVLAALTPQNALIMRTLLHTGMRLSDVLALKTAQLRPSGWYTEGKTGKRRRFGLPAELLESIKAQAGPEWAFPGLSARGGHKTRQAVWKDVKRASRAFRLPQNVGPHSARKIYAVDLMAKYGDIERVRRALNHESSTVTALYAMADMLTDRRLAARRRRSRPSGARSRGQQ